MSFTPKDPSKKNPKTFTLFARFDGYITVNLEAFEKDPEGEVARAVQAADTKIDPLHGYVPATEHYDEHHNEYDLNFEIDF